MGASYEFHPTNLFLAVSGLLAVIFDQIAPLHRACEVNVGPRHQHYFMHSISSPRHKLVLHINLQGEKVQ